MQMHFFVLNYYLMEVDGGLHASLYVYSIWYPIVLNVILNINLRWFRIHKTNLKCNFFTSNHILTTPKWQFSVSGHNWKRTFDFMKQISHFCTDFVRPESSRLGFSQPVCFTLWGMAALDSLRSFLSFHSFIHQGLSPLSFPLVTKGFPFGHQGSTSPFTFFWSEVWRTKNERTNERTGRNHEPCLLLV